jgi:amino-acid N-acetyltransferase
VRLRKAVMSDTEEIYKLISMFAIQGQLLHRTRASIFEHLQCFFVAEENGQILGTVSLHILDYDLAEIRSLAVNPNVVLRGIGKSLVKQLIDETISLGIRRLIALTYQDIFFHKCGFEVVSKETLHPKIIKDCMSCAKFNSCDEIAMQINLL